MLAPPASLVDAYIISHGEEVTYLTSTNGAINQNSLKYLCGMQEFLDALDSEGSTIDVVVAFSAVETQDRRYLIG